MHLSQPHTVLYQPSLRAESLWIVSIDVIELRRESVDPDKCTGGEVKPV